MVEVQLFIKGNFEPIVFHEFVLLAICSIAIIFIYAFHSIDSETIDFKSNERKSFQNTYFYDSLYILHLFLHCKKHIAPSPPPSLFVDMSTIIKLFFNFLIDASPYESIIYMYIWVAKLCLQQAESGRASKRRKQFS